MRPITYNPPQHSKLDIPYQAKYLIDFNKASGLFEKEQIHKEYIAKAHSILKEEKGTIEQPLITDWINRPKQKITYKMATPSKTKFTLLNTVKNSSTVKPQPITDRSHQLRVHMPSLGLAILGDYLYATQKTKKSGNRLLLHSMNINFIHPLRKNTINIHCDVDFL